jgi:hypothetical protein
MKRKKNSKISSQGWNFNDFKWCVDNDFQVYIVPISNKESVVDMDTGEVIEEYYKANGLFKIAVRRGGITTEGKDWAIVKGRRFNSKETLSGLTFSSQTDAENHLNYTYKYLRNKYGRD